MHWVWVSVRQGVSQKVTYESQKLERVRGLETSLGSHHCHGGCQKRRDRRCPLWTERQARMREVGSVRGREESSEVTSGKDILQTCSYGTVNSSGSAVSLKTISSASGGRSQITVGWAVSGRWKREESMYRLLYTFQQSGWGRKLLGKSWRSFRVEEILFFRLRELCINLYIGWDHTNSRIRGMLKI